MGLSVPAHSMLEKSENGGFTLNTHNFKMLISVQNIPEEFKSTNWSFFYMFQFEENSVTEVMWLL